ncbi:MAG: sialidase family protein [Tepidisphaeraceae bacterium]
MCCAVMMFASSASAEPMLETTDLFEAVQDGYKIFRIPGIIVTPKGTLIAYCEARRSGSDWGEIDILLRRSTDGGRTWSPPARVAEMPADAVRNAYAPKKVPSDRAITLDNPVAIADRSGAVHLLYCVEYARCFYRRSDDDGVTFGPPVEITNAFEPLRAAHDWKVIATGPGHGIQLKSGRLLVPVWISLGTLNGHGESRVATIYSDDEGKTWKAGEVLPVQDKFESPNETAAAELSDGRVMLNVRHIGKPPLFRGITTSPTGIGEWSAVRFDEALPEPICMASLLSLGGRRLLFSNPHNATNRDRKNLTIKLSEDDGATWPIARTLEPGPSAYSDLAIGADGTIYCFFERGEKGPYERLTLARFNVEWLKQNQPAPTTTKTSSRGSLGDRGISGSKATLDPEIPRVVKLPSE